MNSEDSSWFSGASQGRRSFLKTSIALGMAVSTGGILLPDGAQASVPLASSGGHLRLGLAGGATTDSLDPALWSDSYMILIGFAVRSNLFEIGPDGNLLPDTVRTWEHSADARTWRFETVKGATFSNGKALTAADVVASLNYHRGEQSRSAARAVFEGVEDIQLDGRDAFIVRLNAPNVDFAYSLSDQHLNILPSSEGVVDWRSGIGAGPFILEQFEPGVRAVLKRNPNSYRDAYLDSAELVSISDVVSRQSALQSGRVDVINRVSLKTADLLARSKAITVQETVGRLNYWLTANTQASPYDNADLRNALKYGLDRQQLLDVVFNGHGRIGNDQPITPGYRYFNVENTPKAYDPDKARFLIKKAGLDRLSVRLHTSEAAFPGAVDFAVLYKQQASRAGIDIDVVREGADGYWAKVKTNTPSWYMTYWSGRMTEDDMLSTVFAPTSQRNYTHWNNPTFNALLAAARSETDDARRRAMYGEMQTLVSDDGGAVIPIFGNYLNAFTQRVRPSAKMATNEDLDGGRLLERWSLTAV
ncbi:ABC transporter substrate-binding protein [Pseudomonas sp. B21-036]|jgi:peptide/nickel transport system substrate-binding protein|uniref:ABC transporter substrate-binding protein n=1 Tax=Pseudomonas sp. B21-036 TaxID=2895485 RepID=UPI002160578A|nr:ABC transporter substrate-binding protein [Pseudomonas sp. B21-036]UVL53647.1 ABC transporter substrate-binding protein [Pseudomonas sp. B21-036]